MSKIRFYVDEHVANAVARGLLLRGIDVVTVADAGLRGATDEEHLEFALKMGRVIFTRDADFLRLHASGRRHTGIVFAPQQTSTGEVVRGLVLVHQLIEAEEMIGRIEFW